MAVDPGERSAVGNFEQIHNAEAIVAAAGGVSAAASLELVDPSRREIVAASIDLANRIADYPGYEYELNHEDLGTIVKVNVVAELLNQPNFERIFGKDGSKFKPVLFQKPDVVLVKTVGGVIPLTVDGFHREKRLLSFL